MQQQQMMIDLSLQNELKPGEQLLWWGRCDPKRKAKSININTGIGVGAQTANYIIYSVLAIAGLGLIFNALHLISEENNLFGRPDPTSIFLLLFSIVLLLLFVYRIYHMYSLTQRQTTNLRNTTYGITNRRVIVMIAKKQGPTVHSFTQNDIGQINRVETGGGWGDVAFGKVRQIQRGMRTLTITEKLQGIPNAHMVEDILVRTFKSPDASWSPEYVSQPQMQPHYPPMLIQYPTQQPAPPASQPQE